MSQVYEGSMNTVPNTPQVNLYDTAMNNAVCHEDSVLCYSVSKRNNTRIGLHFKPDINNMTHS